MKLIDIWEAKEGPTISFELFPARSAKAAENLDKAIDRLAALKPDFVSVTFGAGGSTRDGSRQLVEKLKSEKGLEVLAYFAGYGLGPDDIESILDEHETLGLDNVLLVRGDVVNVQEGFKPHSESFPHASDLMTFIRPKYDLCLGVAGYPEGHIQAVSKEKDLEYLKLKVDNGADYVICNYFYDTRFFFDFVERCRSLGIDVPIVPGIMPIYSIKMMEMLASLCGATIVDDVRQGIASLPEGDKEALVNFGIELAVRQCRELLETDVPGLHFYTMDRSKSAVGIINRLRCEGFL
jgi:methylenetetrahydrofolate reductase (NADPH)